MPTKISVNTDAGRINFLSRAGMQHQNDVAAGSPILSDDVVNRSTNLLPQRMPFARFLRTMFQSCK